MGAWGYRIFDNDSAADWAFSLAESQGTALISNTIDRVFEEDYIDADVASEGLAAMEAVASLLNRPGESSVYSEPMAAWMQKNKIEIPTQLVEKSIKAIDLILGDRSELHELWLDSEYPKQWEQEVLNLRQRLSASEDVER